ncbi:MAG: alkaline phosphatase D family protein [Alphaproteobacteria bacterium]
MIVSDMRAAAAIPTRRSVLLGLLAGAGCFTAAAGTVTPPDPASSRGGLPPGGVRFPQGVASGDPQPDGVVLWTRAVPAEGGAEPVPLLAQVSKHSDFRNVVLSVPVEATAASDHTVRLFVCQLEPGTDYFFRFVAGADISAPVGRTFTAPDPDDPRPIRIASVSCQNYQAGTFAAYRRMIEEDEARPPEDRIRLVLHLGDFVYETLYRAPEPDDPEPISVRSLPPLPSGGGESDLGPYARTLADYRHLYKVYLQDPDLQAARARWPFVCTWDDHEFANDAWQSHTTVNGGGSPAQSSRLAANQAWFEFVPALLTGARGVGGVPAQAHDFRAPASPVEDAPVPPTGLRGEPNNCAAAGSLRIYRSLALGRHLDLIVTDTRAYRSDHPVPERLNPLMSGGRSGIPVTVVKTFDAGRDAEGGNPPETVDLLGHHIPNLRRTSPPGTMLGAGQKAWWKDSMAASTATWRVWASSVPVMPLRLDTGSLLRALGDTVLTTDSWEGYPAERRELTKFLRDRSVANVIVLSGDHHAAMAGVIGADPEGPEGPVAVEICTPGISSVSMFDLARRSRDERSRPLVWYRELADMVKTAGPGPDGPRDRVNLNTTLLYGIKAAVTATLTRLPGLARLFRNPAQNPHLRFVDSAAYGYTVLRVSEAHVDAEQTVLAAPRGADGQGAGRLRYRVSYRVAACPCGSQTGDPLLDGPFFEGPPPNPFGPNPFATVDPGMGKKSVRRLATHRGQPPISLDEPTF